MNVVSVHTGVGDEDEDVGDGGDDTGNSSGVS